MKKFGKIAGGSSFALALMMGMTSAAEAQTAPAPAPTGAKADKADKDEVVITGSFIRGTPEDAAIPVNAVTLKELQNQGSPSTMDLVKSMTDVGASRGEGDRRGAGSTVGAQTINLRELGSDRTLVLVNGRRLPDQITVGARFNNIAVVPNNVLGRVETLRDGGAVTYGSDAIAGVVNFITRRDFEGFKVRGNYRSIKGTDGDYDADMLWGAKGDDASILLSAQFQHGSTLMAKDRDWAQHLFYQNNDITAWSSTGSPGSFVMNTTTNATTKQLGTAITPGGAGPLGYNTTNAPGAATGGLLRQMSSTGVTRDPGCRPQLDTFNGFLATSPVCYFHIAAYDKLREEKNEYTFYGEVNFSLPVGIKYHGEGSWYRLDLPDVINTPSDTGGPAPQILCTAVGVSTLGPNAACTLKGQYLGALTGIQVPGSNPAVVDILNKLIASNGGQTLSPTQITNITTGGGLSMSSWRPFGTFGNPVFGTYDRQRNNSDQIRLTSEFSGDLPSILGINLDWSAAFTGTHNVQVINGHDILIDRLQSALNGFGGAQCGTLVAGVYTIQPGTLPGVGGCKYLNPFSSAYAVNLNNGARNDDPYNALTNPNPGTYNSGLVNSADLINWLYAPIRYERDYTNVLADLKFTGDLPVELPGGPVAIAFGGQFRFEKDLFTLDDLSNQKISPCTAPRSTVCTDNGATAGSPLFGSRNTGIFGTALETKRQYPAWSAFGEAQLPIFDTLNVDLAARYEKFISDTSDKDNSVVAPQASAKWQATDWLYFRGTIGKTFANVVQPPNDPPVTFLSNAAIAGGSVGTTALPYINKVVPNFDVSPETGLNYSYGAAVKKGPFEAKIDYYSIEIDNLARPAISAANILAGSTTNGLATDSSPVNCDSPLINTLLTQATGAGAAATCSPAAHSGGGPATVTVAQFFTGANRGVIQNYPLPRSVNSGTLSTEGIDVSLAYRVEDVIPGTLQLNLDVTKVLSWNMSDLLLNGALISRGYDGVGFINAGNPQKNGGQLVSEYKAAAGFNYTVGRHNLNWRTTWRSALTVDAPLATTLKTAVNANVGTNAFIANCGTSATGFTAGPNTVIPGAGLAVWGATLGACATDATTISGGTETLPDYFNSDLSYRVTLPWQTTFTATVQNVFDVDPGFYRAADSYSSFLESPLGRTVRVGLEKKF